VGGKELRHDGCHIFASDPGGRGDPDEAADRTVTLLEETPERLELADEGTRTLVEAMPLGREAHPTRGPLEEANAQAPLEAPHVLTNGRRRDREALGRRGEAAALHGEDEGEQRRRRKTRNFCL